MNHILSSILLIFPLGLLTAVYIQSCDWVIITVDAVSRKSKFRRTLFSGFEYLYFLKSKWQAITPWLVRRPQPSSWGPSRPWRSRTCCQPWICPHSPTLQPSPDDCQHWRAAGRGTGRPRCSWRCGFPWTPPSSPGVATVGSVCQ